MTQHVCGCCGAVDVSGGATFPLIDRAREEVLVLLCADCCAFTPLYQRTVPDETIRQTEYHFDLWKETTLSDMEISAENLRAVVRFYRDVFTAPDADGLIVEIGSGRGCLLRALHLEGYNAIGCEPSDGLVKMASEVFGFDDQTLRLTDAATFIHDMIDSGTVAKAIILWHVIEHVANPFELLRSAARVLAPEGQLILQAPMPSEGNIFPEHIYLFNRHLVFQMAKMAGLKVVFCDISHHEQFISFSLARIDSRWPEVSPPLYDVAHQWCIDLLRGAQIALETRTAQTRMIQERDITIARLRGPLSQATCQEVD